LIDVYQQQHNNNLHEHFVQFKYIFDQIEVIQKNITVLQCFHLFFIKRNILCIKLRDNIIIFKYVHFFFCMQILINDNVSSFEIVNQFLLVDINKI
jgi:hypothetical protein